MYCLGEERSAASTLEDMASIPITTKALDKTLFFSIFMLDISPNSAISAPLYICNNRRATFLSTWCKPLGSDLDIIAKTFTRNQRPRIWGHTLCDAWTGY
jgi:hypothetical protein